MQNFQGHRRRSLTAALLLTTSAAVLLSAEGAWAQTAAANPAAPLPEAAAAPETNAVEAIVVTGSRLQAGFQAPTPVTVVGTAQIQTRAPADVYDIVSQLPSFKNSSGPSNNSYGIQNASQANLDLRGLGATRTLTLIDGARHVATNQTNNVDTNIIPTMFIERVDTVTGGASAAYGSDAVAGVVNFIINTHLQGIQGQAYYGLSQQGDNREKSGNLAYGTDFAGGKGHLEFGGEYTDNAGVGDWITARPWGAAEPGLVTLGSPRPAGIPANIFSNGVENIGSSPQGLITSGPLKGTTFDINGNPYNITYGSLVGSGTTGEMLAPAGGDGNYGNVNYLFSQIRAPFERGAALANLSYEVAPDIDFNARAMFGSLRTYNTTIPVPNPSPFIVLANNPFMPAALKTAMAANNLSSVTIWRSDVDVGPLTSGNLTKSTQLNASLNGQFAGGWKWDVNYGHGETTLRAELLATPRESDLYTAAYVVPGPNGTPVCGPSATNPNLAAGNANNLGLTAAQLAHDVANVTPGCVPYNVFGSGLNGNNAQSIKYFDGASVQYSYLHEDEVSVNLNGEPVMLPAGPMSLAVGAEYRHDFDNIVGCPDCQNFLLVNQNYPTYTGATTVKEGYAEVGVPVVKDKPLFKSLDLNAALRVTDYSLSGTVKTYKIGATWDMSDFLRFRVTRSHDIRAPNINELFNPGSNGKSSVSNPVSGATGFVNSTTNGNPNLVPEVSNTDSMGLVFQPQGGPLGGLHASVDFYRIVIDGVIGTVSPQQIMNAIFLQNSTIYNQYVIKDSSALGVNTVNSLEQNLSALKNAGLDFEVAYRVPLASFDLPGRLDIRSLATRVLRNRTIINGVVTEQNGATQGTPKLSINTNVTYTVGKFTVNVLNRYTSPIKYSDLLVGPDDPAYNAASSTSVNRNLFPSTMLWYLYGAVDVIQDGNRKLQLFANVDNVFNKQPPLIAMQITGGGNPYDLVGRAFKIGLRFTY